ncbi:MAG TPA: large conductance mechanosensitive channel protein MscL [Bacillota bacterium]|nr:large conductance mechanosensitive channel protein MscL [Bacillota bacterium]
MWKEFKAFAMRGNVIDLAVGVIIGGAFGKIVSSLVGDIIMPLVGLLLGRVDFASLSVTLGTATLNYGLFINNVVDFLIIAFALFMVIRQVNRMTKKKEEPEPVKTKTCKYCFSEIYIDASKCPHCTSDLSN